MKTINDQEQSDSVLDRALDIFFKWKKEKRPRTVTYTNCKMLAYYWDHNTKNGNAVYRFCLGVGRDSEDKHGTKVWDDLISGTTKPNAGFTSSIGRHPGQLDSATIRYTASGRVVMIDAVKEFS